MGLRGRQRGRALKAGSQLEKMADLHTTAEQNTLLAFSGLLSVTHCV
jgi:hypothetical protein